MKLQLGWGICGSFCCLEKVFSQMELLADSFDIYPIFSFNAASTDTRFGKAADFIARAETMCGKKAITTIAGAEPIGPKKLLDVMLVSPCTGNTLGKLAAAVTDTPVTMACKAQLRNKRSVLLAPSTNDGLSASATAIGTLLQRRNVFFVPFLQDDPLGKPTSLCSDFTLMGEAVRMAAEYKQMQPVIRGKS